MSSSKQGHTEAAPAEWFDDDELPTSATASGTIGDVIAARLARRDLIKGALASSVLAVALPEGFMAAQPAKAQGAPQGAASAFSFKEVPAKVTGDHEVAEGYDADILIRWGDPVLPGAADFQPRQQSKASQAKQFGYNNDFLGYFPIDGSKRGLLAVNHEYTSTELLFSGLKSVAEARNAATKQLTKETSEVEMMAHGGSVIEVERGGDGKWKVVPNSRYARRITAETPMEITGPAAGHERMKTNADPSGKLVLGMLNNCAGGTTPWGTWVTCEENINYYFLGPLPEGHRESANWKRYGLPGRRYAWGNYFDRFKVEKEPNEVNRFGWIVEIDPFDPNSTPKKRTALGRFKHEGAAGIINPAGGQYVLYSGDDQIEDYCYRFVTKGKVDTANRAANRDLLDEGVLSVARFDADGTMRWLPLVFGQGPLTPANGFQSQADVLIETRRAADLLGATKLDRPEDVEANPVTGKIYVMLTKNATRKADKLDAANPRPANVHGHILELTPPGGDQAADVFKWEILVKCGDPSVAAVGATFNPMTSKDGWFSNPDNCAFDAMGRLWVTTDGNADDFNGRADGVWAVDTEGAARGTSKHFYRTPAGAEMCGPCFTPDMETFFVAVQHPGEDGKEWLAWGRDSTFDDPSTRWPDFKDGVPPRPSIVAITRKGGGKIGV
ncbi:MAG: PhoX family phosphatase [Proteobacteria bacterium]|nr:PhoX family phosphatase [Pseudomonadota bacterium]